MIGSILLVPFAYLKLCGYKFQACLENNHWKIKLRYYINFLLYAVFGPVILALDLIPDFVYFWKNNFRSNLQKIIIERQKSSVTNDSIRQIVTMCNKYSE